MICRFSLSILFLSSCLIVGCNDEQIECKLQELPLSPGVRVLHTCASDNRLTYRDVTRRIDSGKKKVELIEEYHPNGILRLKEYYGMRGYPLLTEYFDLDGQLNSREVDWEYDIMLNNIVSVGDTVELLVLFPPYEFSQTDVFLIAADGEKKTFSKEFDYIWSYQTVAAEEGEHELNVWVESFDKLENINRKFEAKINLRVN